MLYFLIIFTKTDRKIQFYNVFYFIELTNINDVNPPLLSYVALNSGLDYELGT